MTRFALDPKQRAELLERFLRYVRIDTQSDDDSTTSPSTEKQKDLARLLAGELESLGCRDVRLTSHGQVFATVPDTLPTGHVARERVPAVGLLAHMDTYPATSGTNVKPQVITRYDGADIALPGDPAQVLRRPENPNLGRCIGHTLITSDGTTLLGADDKAGVAEIMTAVAWMREHPEFAHGPVRIGFTPDEEVGRGTDHFDVAAFGCAYAYTLDGADIGEIEDETFSADAATVVIEGHDVHPGYAKGKMSNAVRFAAAVIDRLPREFLPETTEHRQPYLHPLQVTGGVARVEIRLLVRAFTERELQEREEVLAGILEEVGREFPGAKHTLTVKESYRNMAVKIAEDPRVLDHAIEAVRRMGLEPVRKPMRGGTDGSRLSYMGLLTPNLWAGGQNFHSVREWVSARVDGRGRGGRVERAGRLGGAVGGRVKLPLRAATPPAPAHRERLFSDGREMRFACERCGDCCRRAGVVYFSPADVRRAAEFLGLTIREFRATYLKKEDGRWFVDGEAGQSCVFFDEAAVACRIHAVKPLQCRAWPFWPETHRSRRSWSEAASHCPGMGKGTGARPGGGAPVVHRDGKTRRGIGGGRPGAALATPALNPPTDAG